jgi:IS605 OrfB family transposase
LQKGHFPIGKSGFIGWRISNGPRKSLGWIPFKAAAVVYKQGQVFFRGKALSLWDSYGLSNYKLGAGSISQDARGRWYFNVTVEVKKIQTSKAPLDTTKVIGIDLGLTDVIVSNDGLQVEAQKFYRKLEDQLAKAQRAKNKHRTRAIHAKIANQRKDFNHKQSTALVRKYKALFVGNVSAQKMTQTRQAKSVLDAGWSQFRTMLQYKCDNAGVWFKEINESYTTQECSVCTEKTGPKGLEGLKVRHWICPICHTQHQRDINAATNIKQRGIKWLLDECSVVLESTDSGIMNKADANSLGSDIGPLAEGIPSL